MVAFIRVKGAVGAVVAMSLAASDDAVLDVRAAVAIVVASAALSTLTALTGVVGSRRSDVVVGSHVGGDMLNMMTAMAVIDPTGSTATWTLLLVPIGEAVLLARNPRVAVAAVVAAIVGIAGLVFVSVGFNVEALGRWALVVFLAGGPMSVFLAQATRVQAALTRSNEDRARLDEMAITDELTGLYNRRGLTRCCDDEPDLTAVIMIDLDHFKNVNDTLGHEAGDEVLRTVAHRLSEVVGSSGDVARLGGDEFGIVIRDDVDLAVLRERIGVAVRRPVDVRGVEAFVEASTGIVVPRAGDDLLSLLDAADCEMFAHKARRHDDLSASSPMGRNDEAKPSAVALSAMSSSRR